MNKEFIEYLEQLGMKKPLLDRAESIFEFYQSIGTGDIADIFVSEYVNEEGARTFESLWFFTAKASMEAKNFPSEDHFDYTPLPESTIYWELKKKDFQPTESAEKSRLTVELVFHGSGAASLTGTLKASGTNCEALFAIFKKYFAVKH
jgi:hypothetical protein